MGAELNLRPWLYRIAHNTALNALRDRGLRHDQLDESIDGVERPDQALERSQGLRDVLVAVQALPDRQRDDQLRALEGRSYAEIALARSHRRRGAPASEPCAQLTAGGGRGGDADAALTRLASADSAEPVSARVAEMVGVGAAGSGALIAKVCATALVTGAVVGGVAVAPDSGPDGRRGPSVGAERARAAGGEHR